MTRLQFLFAFSFLSTCECVPAQVSIPSFFCPEIFLGQLRLNLQVLPTGNSSSTLLPGILLRVSLGIVVNGQNEIPDTPAGTYPGTDPCSLSTGAFTTTFNVPIVLTIAGAGMQRTYTVSVPDFARSFNLGTPGNLSLSLQGATRGPVPIFASIIEIATLGGSLLLTPTPAPTPLPPSIILTLTGLAGAGLLTARRGFSQLTELFHSENFNITSPSESHRPRATLFRAFRAIHFLPHAIPDDRVQLFAVLSRRVPPPVFLGTVDQVGFADGLMPI